MSNTLVHMCTLLLHGERASLAAVTNWYLQRPCDTALVALPGICNQAHYQVLVAVHPLQVCTCNEADTAMQVVI